ncbi:MAG: iron ABC transporter permease [Candidatus Omnitrophica bacterium]|nr:iron ABC transporter permease [Candidatus Omnitrophota bacterium]
MKMRLGKQLPVLLLLLCAAIILALAKGAVNIPLSGLLLKENQVVFNMRIFRIIVAVLAGSGLAVSGIALQAILRNPLAEPYLLGTSSGAGLAAVTWLVLGLSRVYIPLAAFLGAVISIILVYNLAQERGRVSDKSLILSGVIVSIAFSSLIVFLVFLSGNRAAHEMTWWLWGSFQVYDYKLVGLVALPVILGICALYLFSQDLNAISMGEEEATHLGIDTQNIKKLVILITALITASLICICGIIGFVGLIVPHMMRLVFGPNHKVLIPAACLAASVFMVVCDLISRTLFAPAEIPVGVITAVIGAPVFIILLKRDKRS